MTRSEAAGLLGVSVSTVRRLEGDALTPVVGLDGVHRFNRTQVEAARVVVRKTTTSASYDPLDVDGETAAKVFELFDAKKSPVDVVKETRLHPSSIERLHTQWGRMSGGIVLNRHHFNAVFDALNDMNALVPHTIGQVFDADELVASILKLEDHYIDEERHEKARMCHACRDGEAHRPKHAVWCDGHARSRYGHVG